MDLRMPRMDGIEATRRIVAEGGPTRVLVLTTFEGEELTFRALQAGAAGYLLKDAGGARLVAAVEAHAAG
jgi:DNA-binding NarL/FixJ family response regulator